MKEILFFALGVAGISMMLSTAGLRAEDWTTTDGKVYQDVKVVKAEPDAVTILHHDGGALVPLAKLSPDLQKRFNYDPAVAKAAAEARTQADAENAKALQAEMDQAQRQRQAKLVAADPRVQNCTLAATDDSSASSDSLAAGPTDPTHHSRNDLIDPSQSLYADHPDSSHHSETDLVDPSVRLRDDHPDPSHRSIDSLVASARNLSSDPSDPKHHSMDQLFGGDPLARP